MPFDVDYKKLYDQVKKGLPEIIKMTGKDVVLVMGPTRSGKTTLINRMLGHEMVAECRDHAGNKKVERGRRRRTGNASIGVYRDDTKNQHLPFFEVKGSNSSETSYPMTVVHDDTCYVDVPGLEGNTDEEEPHIPLAANLLLELGLSLAKSVKTILLVFNKFNFTDDSMKPLKDVIKQLNGLLKDITQSQAIHLVMNNKVKVREVYDNYGVTIHQNL